jgi:hypothetical protein
MYYDLGLYKSEAIDGTQCHKNLQRIARSPPVMTYPTPKNIAQEIIVQTMIHFHTIPPKGEFTLTTDMGSH